MHPEKDHKPYVQHPNMPVLSLDSEQCGGDSWRVPSIGEVVGTSWQAFSLVPRPRWKMSAYWTHEQYKHSGLTNYRVPVSIGAWLTVLGPLTKKLWKGLWSGEAFTGAPAKAKKKG